MVGNDLIVIAVDNQNRDSDALEIFREIRLRERDDTVVVRFGSPSFPDATSSR